MLIGLSLFLTFYVMAPTPDEINATAYQPYMRKEISLRRGAKPRSEADSRVYASPDLHQRFESLFTHAQGAPPRTPDEVPMSVLIPALHAERA